MLNKQLVSICKDECPEFRSRSIFAYRIRRICTAGLRSNRREGKSIASCRCHATSTYPPIRLIHWAKAPIRRGHIDRLCRDVQTEATRSGHDKGRGAGPLRNSASARKPVQVRTHADGDSSWKERASGS